MLYYMILMHLLYDFHWQGQFVGEYKSKYVFILFIHSLTYAMIVGIPYAISGNWIVLLILLISHYFIDGCKSIAIKKYGEKMWLVYIDQALHFIIILMVWYSWRA